MQGQKTKKEKTLFVRFRPISISASWVPGGPGRGGPAEGVDAG